MEILNLLNKSIQDRFVAQSTIAAIEERISEQINRKIYELYKNKIIHYENLDFQLIGVYSLCSNYSCAASYNEKIEVRLDFICISNLPKDKKARVDREIQRYKQEKSLSWNNLKVKLWRSLYYDLNVKDCIEKDAINLTISFD